jgi:cellulose synthase/poly-beta-1,6-N-acetylglucosamine synthase-like glycosyltransferase
MLRSEIFGKITASVGILANVITLAFYLGLAFVSTSLPLGVDLYYVSGLLSLIWYFQIGRRLYQMGRLER